MTAKLKSNLYFGPVHIFLIVDTDSLCRFISSSGIETIYKLSYLYYTAMGLIIVVVLGLIITFFTGELRATIASLT